MTLTDTHLVLLSAAARQELQLLFRPDKLSDQAARKLAGRLVSAGLAEEVGVKPNQPHWSVNEVGDAVGLRITAAGLAAIGLEGESAGLVAHSEPPDAGSISGDAAGAEDRGLAPVPQSLPHPRPGSKQALVIGLLRRESGATVEALMAATGWLPHTVRAALTGLRHKGLVLTKTRDGAGVTHYHLTEPAGEAGAGSDVGRAE